MKKLIFFLITLLALSNNELFAQCTTPSDPNPMSPIQITCAENALIEPTGSNGFYYFFADASGNVFLDSGTSFTSDALGGDTVFYFAAADLPPGQPFTFTNCGASGRVGPTQAQANAAYNATNLDGLVTILGSGIQEWTVPTTGTYIIEAYGAQGGSAGGGAGGKGAKVVGVFQLTAGQKLHIIVGQKGGAYEANTRRWQASGGGGSFVVFENATNTNDILVIAGGGGGFAFNRTTNNVDGQITTNGGNGSGATTGANGGTNGNGGASNTGGTFGGGGGFSGNGATGTTRGGRSFLNGAEGGTATNSIGEGGFGGGGGVNQVNTDSRRNAGGGGGYSGGGAASSTSTTNDASTIGINAGAAGGGGGSFNNGTNQIMVAGDKEGDGLVVITYLPPACLSNILSVEVHVNDLDAPDAIPTINSLCGDQALIEPTGSTGYYQFFSDASGQQAIGIGSTFTTGTLFGDTTLYVAAIPANLPLVVLDTFVFTNAGKTGFSGPNQSEINAAYASTNLNGLVTINEPGIQEWVVPVSGLYKIKAAGASGADIGGAGEPGLGAVMEGVFFLLEGQVLNIVVGQEGNANNTNGGGGGGGSYVVFDGATADEHILLIAGGGGTCVGKANNGIAHGKISPNGSDGERTSGVYAGGFNGRGGEGQQNTAGAGGGFGGLTSCSGHPGEPNCGDAFNTTTNGDGIRGAGFVSTASQNDRANGGGARGGFGGGGGANTGNLGRVGGGGGYSGGGSGFNGNGNPSCSGGGGSYNAGFNQLNFDGANQGHGRVEIVLAEILCKSDIIPVNIIVESIDPPTISGESVICIDTMVMLTASGSAGTYGWYDDPAATNLLDTGAVFITPILTSSATYYAKAFTFNLVDTVVYHFTNAGQTGRFGPNQAAIDAAYANTNLDGQVTVTTPGIQEWTVPADGLYKISAAGASGAVLGSADQLGRGALMEGYFELTAGQKLNIAVGQEGIAASPYGGGGGGTFVVFDGANDDDDILVIAGGGGSCFGKTNTGGAHGQITTTASDGDRSTGVWAGGFNGRGGEGSQNTVGGGGGYGGLTVCAGHPGEPDCGDAYNSSPNSDTRRGGGFLSTAAQTNRGDGGNANGGFGGGGGYNGTNQSRIGGGGGYSGGGAGFTNTTSVCSGGGGSYNSGINQNNITGFNAGHGYVTISAVSIAIDCESPVVAHEIAYYSADDQVTIQGAGSYCLGQEVELTASGTPIPQDIWEWYENTLDDPPFLTGQTSATVSPTINTDYIVRIPIVGLGCVPLVSDTITVSVPTPNNSLSANNVTATCLVNQTGWVHFLDNNGDLVVSINSNGQNLGNVDATSFIQNSPLLVAACDDNSVLTSVLDRHWVITPEFNNPGSPISIRLPLQQAELNSLASASQGNNNPGDNVSSIGDLNLSKYSGPNNVDADFANNCDSLGGNGNVQLILQSGNGSINEAAIFSNHSAQDLYVEYSITSFSEFWLHGSDNSALPVTFSDFSVECNGGITTIRWVTESEMNASHYDLLKSNDGLAWHTFNTVTAVGNSTTQTVYEVEDRLFGQLVYYQLVQHDLDGQFTKLNPISSQCHTSGLAVELFPNPASNVLMINYRNSDNAVTIERLEFIDAQGRLINMDYTLVTPTQAQVKVENVFDAVYFVKIHLSNGNFLIERFAVH